MITVQEADQIISQNIKECFSVRIPLQDAFGMVLREDLVVDRDLPPFHRVMMDGIAINFDAWRNGTREFYLKGLQKAGMPALTLQDSQACLEAMTGAVLPEGCDCVIPVEDIKIEDGQALVKDRLEPVRMQYVHLQGSDCKKGAALVSKGSRLFAPQVAVAASVGKAEVLVSASPKIAVVGTGDEVVAIDQNVEPYQIRQSNSYVIQAALNLYGHNNVERFHMRDDKNELKLRLEKMLEDFDMIVLSGGVSMGKFDYIPEVLKELGVKELLHKVKQRPGKPLWFGKSKEGKPVFGLPGNPVSTQVGTYRYVLPYLDRAMGALKTLETFVSLGADVEVKTDLTYFLPVKINCQQDGRLVADPVFPTGSGDYSALAKSDGFIELPADTFQFSEGTSARFYRWTA